MPTDKERELWCAAQYGNLEEVRRLLDEGVNVNAAGGVFGGTPLISGWVTGHHPFAWVNGTPLMAASRNGHVDVVRLLLERDADVDKAQNDGCTPLIEASRYGKDEVVRLLLERDADVNKADNDYGWTPLIEASRHGKDEVVRLLLERDADVNKADISGRTPLIEASRYGHDAVVRTLLDAGAKLDPVDKDGMTALDNAKKKGHSNIVKMLQEAEQERAAFLQAARDGNLEKVQQSLDKGCVDINTTDDGGKTALMWASANGHEHVVKLLLQRGARIEQTRGRWKKKTALTDAESNGHAKIVKMLEGCERLGVEQWLDQEEASEQQRLQEEKVKEQRERQEAEEQQRREQEAKERKRLAAEAAEQLRRQKEEQQQRKKEQEAWEEKQRREQAVLERRRQEQLEAEQQQLEAEQQQLAAEEDLERRRGEDGATESKLGGSYIRLTEKEYSDICSRLGEADNKINRFLFNLSDDHIDGLSNLADHACQYPEELRNILLFQCQKEQDQVEQEMIRQSPLLWEYYLHLISNLRSLMVSCETLASGKVKQATAFEDYVANAAQAGIRPALKKLATGTMVAEAVDFLTRQASMIPASNALSSVARLLLTFKEKRDQQMGFARICIFAALAHIEYEGGGLDGTIERTARYMVRARVEDIQSGEKKFGRWRSFVTKILGQYENTPSKEQGKIDAGAALAEMMNPKSSCRLECVMGTNPHQRSRVSDALVSAVLGTDVKDVMKLPRISGPVPVAMPRVADEFANSRSPHARTTPRSTSASPTGYFVSPDDRVPVASSKDVEALKKQVNALAQNFKKLQEPSREVNVDAGGGLAQVLVYASAHGESREQTSEALLESHHEMREQIYQLNEENERSKEEIERLRIEVEQLKLAKASGRRRRN